MSTATFLSTDTTTQGTWIGVYGAAGAVIDGYTLPTDLTHLPSWVTFTKSGTSDNGWEEPSTDPRALQNYDGLSRYATCWFDVGSGFSFTLALDSESRSYILSIYAVDFDSTVRGNQFQILDAADDSVLDTQTLSPSFHNGTWLRWTITGSVKIAVTTTAGPNAVVSGLMFDDTGSSPSFFPGAILIGGF